MNDTDFYDNEQEDGCIFGVLFWLVLLFVVAIFLWVL